MSSRRAERLVNLVICLLSTRHYLPANRIRAVVPGYDRDNGTAKSDEAFRRMFERDKADLRELGVPLEVGRNSIFDNEDGYRIARRDYELPDIDLAPDEAAAVGLAAQLWRSGELTQAAHSALVKLRAAGAELDLNALPSLEPYLDAADPALQPCLDAVSARQAIRFLYRSNVSTEPELRAVEPWGVVSWNGGWYLVGHDLGRAATRCFRLSRIHGHITVSGAPSDVTVPDNVNLIEIVSSAGRGQAHQAALLQVRRGAAASLRRMAAKIRQGPGHDIVEILYSESGWLASLIVRCGSDVVVLDPPELRSAVIRRLQALAEAAPA